MGISTTPPHGNGDAGLAEDVVLSLGPERALIGGLLVGLASEEIPTTLRPEEFALERHRVLWETMLGLQAEGYRPDVVTVRQRLQQTDRLAEVGGPAYLAELVDEGVLALHLDEYAQQVRECATARELRRYGMELQRSGLTVEAAEAALAQVPRSMSLKRFDALAVWGQVQARWSVAPVRFGLRALDMLAGGMFPGDLVVIGARTSHGKTSFCGSAALRWSAADLSTAYYTLETMTPGMFTRLVAAKAHVPLHQLRAGSLGLTDLQLADQTAGWLAERPVTIRDTADLGTKQAGRVLERLLADPAQIVVIDHLQEVLTDPKAESRAGALGHFMASLKDVAMRTGKVVVVAAQCSREAERRADRIPTLADLKESGGIEERADMVLLLHHWQRTGDVQHPPDELTVYVAKNRDGGTGKVTVRFQGVYALVSDPDPRPQPGWVTG